MKIALALSLLVGCVTRDSGCGNGGVNSDTAEEQVSKRYGVPVACIKDDEDTYSCSTLDEKRMFRCAESSAARDSIKCIPWFPLE